MWAGWNSLYEKNSEITHRICYLPQINESPTSTSVVRETLKRAKRIAIESQKKKLCYLRLNNSYHCTKDTS